AGCSQRRWRPGDPSAAASVVAWAAEDRPAAARPWVVVIAQPLPVAVGRAPEVLRPLSCCDRTRPLGPRQEPAATATVPLKRSRSVRAAVRQAPGPRDTRRLPSRKLRTPGAGAMGPHDGTGLPFDPPGRTLDGHQLQAIAP